MDTLCLLAQPKKDNKFRNKKPELPENLTIWKSDNPGVEETVIQTGRRGKDGQPGWRGCTARQQLVDWKSHIPVWINQEEQLGSKTD